MCSLDVSFAYLAAQFMHTHPTKTIPDIQAKILKEVEEGNTVWAELCYHGTQTDGKEFNVKGVTLLGIQDG